MDQQRQQVHQNEDPDEIYNSTWVPGGILGSQMMDYEATMSIYEKQINKIIIPIDVEAIPGVPRALQHRKR